MPNDNTPSVASTALLGDPFDSLSLEKIREVRNEAVNHMNDASFQMHGFTFLMPMALMRANSRLMMYRDPPNPESTGQEPRNAN